MSKRTKQVEVPEQLKGINLLPREERISLTKQLIAEKPKVLGPLAPLWWWWEPCEVNVLIVTDTGLDFGLGAFGLSEFLTSFKKLEDQSCTNIKYKVTVAHRGNPGGGALDPMALTNTHIDNRITNFTFDNSVNLDDFDQVWIFAIQPFAGALSANERNVVEDYMNNGGGMFCTGDHGFLGAALCGQIPRVKDMRVWANTDPNNSVNEVSMNGKRRNDTNRPSPGAATATSFNNQSDNIPQTIAVRTFGAGLPHPLLSIKTSLRPSGIIDIMPDHPHEGECAPETTFTVTNPSTGAVHTIATQIIATSFVNGGNTSGGKAATDPHCFPSISVFDGKPAKVGRIVIDSTWHHFVNVNLNGVGGGVGLDGPTFDVIQQYFMNIAKWVSRRKFMLCILKFKWVQLLKNSQIIEASLDNPRAALDELDLHDLYSIGTLAKEIIADEFEPALAEEFMRESLELVSPELAEYLDIWRPAEKENKQVQYGIHDEWIDFDQIMAVAVGAGFIALRDEEKMLLGKEPSSEKVAEAFAKGAKYGLEAATQDLKRSYKAIESTVLKNRK